MPSCFVFGCNSGYKKDVKCHFFRLHRAVTAETVSKWSAILSKVRSDKKFDRSNVNHRVCQNHFEDRYLVKEDVITVGHDRNVIPRIHWTITNDAVPTIFPSIPRNHVKSSPGKRKLPVDRRRKKVLTCTCLKANE